MTPETMRLVRDSWAQVAPLGAAAATLFYEQLFAIDPKLQRLFRSPMEQQGLRLLQMLGTAIDGLDQPAALVPQLRRLGERHVGYGVREAHYLSVGQALIGTLQLALGDAFTAPVRQAWHEVYAFVAMEMLDAAAEMTLPPRVPMQEPA